MRKTILLKLQFDFIYVYIFYVISHVLVSLYEILYQQVPLCKNMKFMY